MSLPAKLGVPSYIAPTLRQTSEVWGNVAGGVRRGAAYTGLLAAGLEVDLDALGWVPGGSLGAVGLFIQGTNVSVDIVGDAGVVSNIAGRETVRHFVIWYQQSFGDEVALKGGLLALDNDFMVVDSALLFVNSGFGTMQTLALNVPAPIYPLAAAGARLRIRPVPDWTIQLGIYDGDAGSESEDRHVSDIALRSSSLFTAVAEVGWRPASLGFYAAFGGVAHLGRVPDRAGTGEERGVGIGYAMWQSTLFTWADSELVAFAHGSIAAPARLVVSDLYFDVGAVLTGHAWRRDADRLGVGLALTSFSPPYRRQQRRVGAAVATDEWVIELTYALKLLRWLSVQPDLQWVIDAHFARRQAAVLGLRVTLEL